MIRPPISICLASFNGAQYIAEQIKSIVSQLIPGDELIVVDDGSSDGTLEILQKIDCPNLQIFKNNSRLGHVKNFEKAIGLANNEFIFLSDQDDIWVDGRLNTMMSEFKDEKVKVIASSFQEFSDVNGIRVFRDPKFHIVENTVFELPKIWIGGGRSPCFGCTMAFRRSFSDVIIPFPKNVEAHDVWLAICGIVANSYRYLNIPTIYRRLHSCNLTPQKPRSLMCIIKSRAARAIQILIALRRMRIHPLEANK